MVDRLLDVVSTSASQHKCATQHRTRLKLMYFEPGAASAMFVPSDFLSQPLHAALLFAHATFVMNRLSSISSNQPSASSMKMRLIGHDRRGYRLVRVFERLLAFDVLFSSNSCC
jgi:hypothetical protein